MFNGEFILDALPDALVVLDIQRKVRFLNVAAEQAGFHPGDDYLARLQELFAPDSADVQAIKRGIAAVSSGRQQRFDLEYRATAGCNKEQPGSVCWFGITITPYVQGRGRGVIIEQREQTEQVEHRKTLESLHENDDLLHLLIDRMQDYAIFLLDPDGCILSWNAGAERIKGYAASEIIGSHFSRFYTEEERQEGKPARVLREAVTLGRFEENGWRVRKDGSTFWANVIVTALRDNRGTLRGYAKVARDITERKTIEDQIHAGIDRSEMLIEISQAFDEVSLNYQMLLDTISRLVALLVGDACLIRLVSPDGEWLEQVAFYHPDPAVVEYLHNLMLFSPQRTDEGWSSQVIKTGRPILIPQMTPDHLETLVKPEYRTTIKQYQVFSALILPLRAQGTVVGIVNVFRNTGYSYTSDDQLFLQDVCDRAALAIVNARLFDDAQREIAERKQAEEALAWEADSNAAIAELSRALLSQIPLDDLSFLVLQQARKLTGSTYGFVGHIDPDTGYLVSSTMTRDIWETCQVPNKSFVFKEFRGLWGWVLKNRQSLMTNTPGNEPRSTGIPPGHIPIRRFLSAPALIGDTLVGQIALANSERDYTQRDLQLVEAMASLYAISLQRKHAEDALRESQQLLRSVVSSAPIILLAVDSRGIVTLAEGKGLLDLGSRPGQDVGTHYTSLYRNQPAMTEHIRRALAGEEINTTVDIEDDIVENGADIQGIEASETSAEQKLPGYKTFEMRVFPMYNEEGAVARVISVGADITERKQAEIVRERAREIAEAATRAKSEFLANMSHEIRTPLNAIIGMTNLLHDTPLNNEQKEFVETVGMSGSALLAIVNDILDFSKIEAGKLELETQPFNLRECVEDALDLLAPNASKKHLNLAYFMDEANPSVFIGDVTRLRQILVNLLSNAVKFTEQGEIVVEVESQPVSAHEHPLPSTSLARQSTLHEIHIAVRDTGTGIPNDRIDRLFRSFSQVDASTARKFGGTGLGLAISKRLAEMMGGTMWVESEMGKGSTFHFTIRVEVSPDQTLVATVPSGQHMPLKGKQVLIIGDSSSNRSILAHHIASWGMVPHLATSADEALEWIRIGIPFDVAVLDMVVPEQDGHTLATRIQSHRPSERLPLILYALVGAAGPLNRRLPLTVSAFLYKPIKPSQLYEVLVSIFEQRDQEGEQDGQKKTPPRLEYPSREGRNPLAALRQINPHMGQEHPLSILLAEDNAINQKVALRLLEKMGYRADVAANGQEVLDALGWRSYDVILMDVQMPEMDGLDATRYIRNHWSSNQQPHIIAMTAHALAGDRQRCLDAGMDDYISKPVQIEQLVDALQRTLRHQPSENSS